MGIIRKTGTRQTRYTANYWCPYRSELVVSEKSIPSPPKTLSNSNESDFFALCRADSYSRHFLETIPYMRSSNDFVFDTQILIQAIHFEMRIAEIPVSTRYFADASSVDFKTSVIYGLKTLGAMARYILHKMRILECRLFMK